MTRHRCVLEPVGWQGGSPEARRRGVFDLTAGQIGNACACGEVLVSGFGRQMRATYGLDVDGMLLEATKRLQEGEARASRHFAEWITWAPLLARLFRGLAEQAFRAGFMVLIATAAHRPVERWWWRWPGWSPPEEETA